MFDSNFYSDNAHELLMQLTRNDLPSFMFTNSDYENIRKNLNEDGLGLPESAKESNRLVGRFTGTNNSTRSIDADRAQALSILEANETSLYNSAHPQTFTNPVVDGFKTTEYVGTDSPSYMRTQYDLVKQHERNALSEYIKADSAQNFISDKINQWKYRNESRVPKAEEEALYKENKVDLKASGNLSKPEISFRIENAKRRKEIEHSLALYQYTGDQTLLDKAATLGVSFGAGMFGTPFDTAVTMVSFFLPETLVGIAGKGAAALDATMQTEKLLNSASKIRTAKSVTQAINLVGKATDTTGREASKMFLKAKALQAGGYQTHMASAITKLKNLEYNGLSAGWKTGLDGLTWAALDIPEAGMRRAYGEETGLYNYTVSDMLQEVMLSGALGVVLPGTLRQVGKALNIQPFELTMKSLDDTKTNIKTKMATGEITLEEGQAYLKTVDEIKTDLTKMRGSFKNPHPIMQQGSDELAKQNASNNTQIARIAYLTECLNTGKRPRVAEVPQGEAIFSHIDARVLNKLLDENANVKEVFGSALTISKTKAGLYTAKIIGENGLLGIRQLSALSEQELLDQIGLMYKGFVLESARPESNALKSFVERARKNAELNNFLDNLITKFEDVKHDATAVNKLYIRTRLEDALLKYFLKDHNADQLPNRISDIQIHKYEQEGMNPEELHKANAKLIGGNYEEAYKQAKELAEQLTWYDHDNKAMKLKKEAKQWFQDIKDMAESSVILADSDNFIKGQRYEKIKESLEKMNIFEISEDTDLHYIFGTPRKTAKEVQQLAEDADSLQQIIDRQRLDFDNENVPETTRLAKSKLKNYANEEGSRNSIYKSNSKIINVVRNNKNTKHLDLKKEFFNIIRTEKPFEDLPVLIDTFLQTENGNPHAVKRKVRLAMSKALDKGGLGVLLTNDIKKSIINTATDAFIKEVGEDPNIVKALYTPEVLVNQMPEMAERTRYSEAERLGAIEDLKQQRTKSQQDYEYEQGRIEANKEMTESDQSQNIARLTDALEQVEKKIQDLKSSEKVAGKKKAAQIRKLLTERKYLQQEYKYASETPYRQQAKERKVVYDPESIDAIIKKIEEVDLKIEKVREPLVKHKGQSNRLEAAKAKLIKALENVKKQSQSTYGKIAEQIKKKRFYESELSAKGKEYDIAVPETPIEMQGKYERIPFEKTDTFSRLTDGIENAKRAIEELKKVPDIQEMDNLTKFFDDQIKLEEQRLSELQQQVAEQAKVVAEIQNSMDIIFQPLAHALDIELSKIELQAMHENSTMIKKMELMMAHPELAAEILTASATQTIYDFKDASRNLEYIRRTAGLYEKDIRNQLYALDKQNNGSLLEYYLIPSNREKIEEAIIHVKHGGDISKFENTQASQIAEVILNSHSNAYQGLIQMGSSYIRPLELINRSQLKYADKAIDDSFVADFKEILKRNLDTVNEESRSRDIVKAVSKILKLNKEADVKQALWAFSDFDLDAMFDKSVIAEYGFNQIRNDILDGRVLDILREAEPEKQQAMVHDIQAIVDKLIGSTVNKVPSVNSWLRKFRTGFEDLGAVLDGSKSAFMDNANNGIIFKNAEAEINATKKFGYDTMDQALIKNFDQALKAEYSIKNFGYNPVGMAEDLMDAFERLRTNDEAFIANIESKIQEQDTNKKMTHFQITPDKKESVKNFIMNACGMREQAPSAPMIVMSALKKMFSFPLLAKAGVKSKSDYGTLAEYMVNSGLISRPEAMDTIIRARVFLQKNPEIARLVAVTTFMESERLLGNILNDSTFSIAQHSEYLTNADKLNNFSNGLIEGFWDKLFDISGATNRHKQTGAFCMMEAIAKHKDYTFEQLKKMGYWLEREGINEQEWDIFRKYLMSDISPDPQNPYIVFNPLQEFNKIPDEEIRKLLQKQGVINISNAAIDNVKKELRNKAYTVVNSSVEEALSMPSDRISSLLRGGQVKGSWKAFMAETMTQYQAFPFAMAYDSYGKIAAHSIRGMTGVTVLDMFNPLVSGLWAQRKEMYGNIFASFLAIGAWMTLIDTGVEAISGQIETPVKEDGSINYGLFVKRAANAMGPVGGALDFAMTALDGSGQRGGGMSIQSTPSVSQVMRFGYRQKKIWASDKVENKWEASGAELLNELGRATSLKTLPVLAPIYQMTIGSYLDMLEQGGEKQWDTYLKGRVRRGYMIMPWEENPEPFNYSF